MNNYTSKILQFLNDDDGGTDETGCFHDNGPDYLGHLFGFCGCGAPHNVLKYINTILTNIKAKHDKDFRDSLGLSFDQACDIERDFFKSEEERYFVLYRLDDLGLIEHGGSVGGSWLTYRGDDVLEALNEVAPELDIY